MPATRRSTPLYTHSPSNSGWVKKLGESSKYEEKIEIEIKIGKTRKDNKPKISSQQS